MTKLTEYRRRLPHFRTENAVFFITFRLNGTLPSSLVKELKGTLEIEDYSLIAKQDYYESINDYLDNENYGPTWLAENRIAELIGNSLKFYDGKCYKLVCYCIMSNHVHFIGLDFNISVNQFIKNLKLILQPMLTRF